MELFRVYDWQGDTFDQFWTFFRTYITFDFLARWYLWPILNLFSDLILLLTIWQGDTFDQFWTFFLDLYYFWLFGKVIPLTNFEPFLDLYYFWLFGKVIPLTNFEPFWTYITFDCLARWCLWPILNLFWTTFLKDI